MGIGTTTTRGGSQAGSDVNRLRVTTEQGLLLTEQNTVHLTTSQSLFTIPDISQSLLGEVLIWRK